MMIRATRRPALWILIAAALLCAALAAVGIVLALRPVQPHSPAGIHYVRDAFPQQGGECIGL